MKPDPWKLRLARRKAGLTQGELAARAWSNPMAKIYVQQCETDWSGGFGKRRAAMLAKALELELEALLSTDEEFEAHRQLAAAWREAGQPRDVQFWISRRRKKP